MNNRLYVPTRRFDRFPAVGVDQVLGNHHSDSRGAWANDLKSRIQVSVSAAAKEISGKAAGGKKIKRDSWASWFRVGATRIVELDPKYVDVVVQRWHGQTGNAGKLSASGQSFGALAAAKRSPA